EPGVPLRRQGSSQAPSGAFNQRGIEVLPFGIHLLDRAQLPEPLPLLHLQLAYARGLQIVMRFIPDEELASVLAREPRNRAVAMLPGAVREIGRDADVERAVAAACHNVDGTGLHGCSMTGLPVKLQSGSRPLPSQGNCRFCLLWSLSRDAVAVGYVHPGGEQQIGKPQPDADQR